MTSAELVAVKDEVSLAVLPSTLCPNLEDGDRSGEAAKTFWNPGKKQRSSVLAPAVIRLTVKIEKKSQKWGQRGVTEVATSLGSLE